VIQPDSARGEMNSEISFDKAKDSKALKELKEQLDRERAKIKQINGSDSCYL
jgi:hypothetical protein